MINKSINIKKKNLYLEIYYIQQNLEEIYLLI
jgi:hypothetical protein